MAKNRAKVHKDFSQIAFEVVQRAVGGTPSIAVPAPKAKPKPARQRSKKAEPTS